MKYCSHCGAELLDEAVLCTKCGCWTNDRGKVAEVSNPRPSLNKLALAGFILSLVSAFISLFFMGIETDSSVLLFTGVPVAISGFICSIVGLVRLKKNKQRGKGFAITGIVLGALVGATWLFLIVFAFIIYFLMIFSLLAVLSVL